MQIEIRNHRVHVDGKPVPFRQTPNTPRRTIAVEGIVLHDTAGHLKGTDSVDWLCNPAAKASANVVVMRDGSIVQLAPLNMVTWHAGVSNYKGRTNCNAFTTGIEIVNPGRMVRYQSGYSNNTAEPHKGVKVSGDLDVKRVKTKEHGDGYWLAYTDAQIETVTELCRAIVAEYGSHFIAAHYEIAPRRKVDVNPRFPLEELRRNVFNARAASFASDQRPQNEVGEGAIAAGPDASFERDDFGLADKAAEAAPSLASRAWSGFVGFIKNRFALTGLTGAGGAGIMSTLGDALREPVTWLAILSIVVIGLIAYLIYDRAIRK
jgi:N-acetylmuramoyl-L-alanine amidase